MQAKKKPVIKITMQKLRNYEAKLRRMCKPSPKRGTLAVSPEVAKQWACKKSRKQLLQCLITSQGDEDGPRKPYKPYTSLYIYIYINPIYICLYMYT